MTSVPMPVINKPNIILSPSKYDKKLRLKDGIQSILCDTVLHKMDWIPSFNLNFLSYLDGLSMIFGLLITGIGTLVILYSIYYLSTEQALIHFYIYILLFMGS